jgi:heme exporter protein CcmD
MEHASFIFGSWAITAVAVGVYALWVIRRGRELAKHATREEMPWT